MSTEKEIMKFIKDAMEVSAEDCPVEIDDIVYQPTIDSKNFEIQLNDGSIYKVQITKLAGPMSF